jgi:hypothetical protein
MVIDKAVKNEKMEEMAETENEDAQSTVSMDSKTETRCKPIKPDVVVLRADERSS